jgi:uncharacterized protein
MPRNGLDWLLNGFVERTGGVKHTLAVSGDGLLVAASRELPPERAEQLAAVVAGMVSLAQAVARTVGDGPVLRTVVQLRGSLLFVMALGDGETLASLATLTSRDCDVGQVTFEMAQLANQVGGLLTPSYR